MALHSPDKQKFALALANGQTDLAMLIARRAHGNDASIEPDLARNLFKWHPDRGKNQSVEPEGKIFSSLFFNKVNPEYARVKIELRNESDLSQEKVDNFEAEVENLIAQCEHRKTYTVLFEVAKGVALERPLAHKLSKLLERGIEHEFFHDRESFKQALSAIALTDCSSQKESGFFRLRQRVERYMRDIYIVDLKKDFNFETYKHARGIFKKEADSLAVQISGKQVIFIIHQRDFQVPAIKELRKCMDRQGVDSFFYFAGEISAALTRQVRPGNYYNSYSKALSAAQRLAGTPKITAPRAGWTTIYPPEYHADGGYFYVPGFIDQKPPDKENYNKDFQALAKSGVSKICFDTADISLPPQVYFDLQTELHTACQEKGGMLVVKSADSFVLGSIGMFLKLDIVHNLQNVRDRFEHYIRIKSPKGGFRYINRPLRYEPNSRILYTEFCPTALSRGHFPGPSDGLTAEIGIALDCEVRGMIFDMGNNTISSDVFRETAREVAKYYDRNFVIVSKNSNTEHDLRIIGKKYEFPVHRSLSEAKLEIEHDISPPSGGWKLFSLRAVNPESPILVVETPKTVFAEDFIRGSIPTEYYEEIKKIAQDTLPVVLDLTNYNGRVSKEAIRAALYMQTLVERAKGQFAVAYQDKVALTLCGIKEVYVNLTAAILDIGDFQQSPLGL